MSAQKERELLDWQSGADKTDDVMKTFLPFQDSPMFCSSSNGFAFITCDYWLFHGKF